MRTCLNSCSSCCPADGRRGLRAGRARLHDDLQRVRRREFRPGRVRDDRRHDDVLPVCRRACRCRLRPGSRCCAAVVVGLLLDKLAIEPARGASVVTLIIITIGASIFLRGVAQIVFDKQFHRLPAFTGEAPIPVFGATILPQSVWVLAGAALDLRRPLGVLRAHADRARRSPPPRPTAWRRSSSASTPTA